MPLLSYSPQLWFFICNKDSFDEAEFKPGMLNFAQNEIFSVLVRILMC